MKRKLLIPALLGSFIVLFAACKNCTKCTNTSLGSELSYEICGNDVKTCYGGVCHDTTVSSAEADALKTSLESSGFTCN